MAIGYWLGEPTRTSSSEDQLFQPALRRASHLQAMTLLSSDEGANQERWERIERLAAVEFAAIAGATAAPIPQPGDSPKDR